MFKSRTVGFKVTRMVMKKIKILTLDSAEVGHVVTSGRFFSAFPRGGFG